MVQAIEAFGLDTTGFASAGRPATDFRAYLELHIEQGPILEAAGVTIGVVQSIVGLHTSELTFLGQASHAGTTSAPMRRDAFRATAEAAAACFERVEICFPPEAQLTFGRAEVRAGSEALIESVVEETGEIAKGVAVGHDVGLVFRMVSREDPAAMSEALVKVIEAACKRPKVSFRHVISGAGHDAQILAQHCPTAMIFVPSRDGISHNPDEHADPAEIETGVNVQLATVLHLIEGAQDPGGPDTVAQDARMY